MFLTKLLMILVINTCLFLFYGLCYFVYSVALTDDVREIVGKHAIRRYQKNTKSFIKRVLFWKLLPYVIKWHYIAFMFYTVCAIASFIILDISFFAESKTLNSLFVSLFIVCGCCTFLMGFVRWSHYKFNITRRRISRRHCSNSIKLREKFYDEFKQHKIARGDGLREPS